MRLMRRRLTGADPLAEIATGIALAVVTVAAVFALLFLVT